MRQTADERMFGQLDNNKRLQAAREFWDEEAAQFDNEPDHGLRDPAISKAWSELLRESLPVKHSRVLDIGCGTGSLSVLLAGLGYDTIGIDFSPKMVALAEAKAAHSGHRIKFQVMDAAFPQLPKQHFDAIVCRHLLWALPEPGQVLKRWADLLKPGGWLFLIEGYWRTGTGLYATEIVQALPTTLTVHSLQGLSDRSALWGGVVTDKRYAITLHCPEPQPDEKYGLTE